MATSTLEVVIRGRDLLSGTLSKVSSELGGLQSKSDGLKSSILAGVGLGAGIGAFGLLTTAIQKGTDVLGDAVAAAMEDEASVKQLSVALMDAIPNWNGHTEAIERTIAAREKFGFSDDALRQSLGTLASVTHDVSRALDLQSLAMNIARFRGIDLASASDMVAKAASGSMKALNAAIPATRGAANAQDALRIATEATAGQMEAYANTTAGKMEAANVRIGESLEKIGYRVLPAVASGLDLVAGSVDLVTTMFGGLLVPLDAATASSTAVAGSIATVGYNTAYTTAQVDALTAAARAAKDAIDDLNGATGDEQAATRIATAAVDDATGATASYRDVLHEAADAARDEAAATLTAAQAYQLYLYTMHNTVNAQTGFTVDTYQQVDAGKAAISNQLDWIITQQRLTDSTRGASAAVRDYTTATEESTIAVKEWVSAVTAADKALAQRPHQMGHGGGSSSGESKSIIDLRTGQPVDGSGEDINTPGIMPRHRFPAASGAGQTQHTWSANGATGGSAGYGGGGTGATYTGSAGVPIVIQLDGRVIAEVVDTYLVRVA